MRPVLRRWAATALGTAAMLALAACGGSSGSGSPQASGSGGSGKTGGTLVFGASSDPVSLDGAYVSDGESLRVVHQIFETLVTTAPGGTDIVPLLATKYEPSNGGKTWTFTLRDGVKFQDGTTMDASAVCTNFDRWYHFTGVQQSASVSYYWQTVFNGYAKNESKDLSTSLYSKCSAPSANTVVIDLTTPSASFLAGLALPAFSIASPTALQKYGADKVSGSGDSPHFDGTFGTTNPVGTGPFKLDSNEPGNRIVLSRFDGYWGDKAKLDKLIIRPIPDGPARRQALESGEIQGYDLVDPGDASALKSAGFQLLSRPAFNVGYVGMNTAKAPFDNQKVRQAVAYALNRQALVTAKYPSGSVVAKEFMPPQLFGYADDVTTYDYNPDKAKQLLAESGNAHPTIEFWYPTNVSRPYMPQPEANFQAFKADLENVGFTVKAKAADWSTDYLDGIQSGQAPIYLYGWTGDFGDPDNFIGTFFRTKEPQWGPIDPTIYSDLEAARKESNQDTRTAMYQAANRKIMQFLPGVPYVHTSPQLAFTPKVSGYVPSPVSIESFAPVSLR